MSSKPTEYVTKSPPDHIQTVDSPRVDLEGMANSDEERRGLLSDGTKNYDEPAHAYSRFRLSRNKAIGVAVGFILLFIGAVVARPLLSRGRPRPEFDSHKLRSNGTHQFKKTSLIVSIDGLRYVLRHIGLRCLTSRTTYHQSRLSRQRIDTPFISNQ